MKQLIAALVLLPTSQALANEEVDKNLNVDAEVGLLNISGNSKSTAIKSRLDIKQEFTSWRNSYLVEGLYKNDTIEILLEGDSPEGDSGANQEVEQLSAKKYFTSIQADYKINEENRGVFVYTSYEYDKFSGYEYQGTLAAGYSDRLFKTDSSFLNYSIGPGAAFSKPVDTIVNDVLVLGESDNVAIMRLSISYQYDISEGLKLTQLLSSDTATKSEDNTKSKSETAVTAQLSRSFALKAAYSITHNSVVLEDIEPTDANASVTLVYSL